MSKTIYDAQFFIDKFSAIPEEKWCIETQNDGRGRHCAFGHCSYHGYEYAALSELSTNGPLPPAYSSSKDIDTIAQINNGDHPNYQQPTPKQRILAALRDIKKMQEGENHIVESTEKVIEPIKEKVKTVYVSVPATILEKAETVLN